MTREMKDSGIEWIGDIPSSWVMERLKYCFSSRNSGAWGEEATGTNGDCICLRVADFDYNKYTINNAATLTVRHYSQKVIEKLILHDGDILVEKSGGGDKTPVGRTVIFNQNISAVFSNFIEKLCCQTRKVHPWYIEYVFVTYYKNDITRSYINQTTGIQNLDLTSILTKERIPLPTIKEQDDIVRVLNKKCISIDAILDKTRASIDSYHSLKQSIITEAVTKGIRGDCPMKDSGIDWIGEIPADWNIKKIKNVAVFINGDRGPNYPSGTDLVDEGIIFITSNNIHGIELDCNPKVSKYINTERYFLLRGAKIKRDDIIYCLRGSVGNCAINTTVYAGTVASSLVDIRPIKVNARYLNYYLHSFANEEQVKECMNGSCAANLSAESVADFYFIEPSSQEQQEIADYLDEKCAAIDTLITKKEQLITELESYKKSLIYEYVTGKKEVPA